MRRKSLGSALLLLACAGQSLNVGNDSRSTTGDDDAVGATSGTGGMWSGGGSPPQSGGTGATGGTSSAPPPEWPAQTGCETDPANQDLVGTWHGQVEDFFLQPLKTLTLVINGASSRGMCGSLKWGDGVPPPPATDPAAPYPAPSIYDVLGYGGSPGNTPLDGFTYTLAQGAVRDRTVRLSIGTRELWQSWCELQPSYSYPEDNWGCVPYSETYSWGPEPTGTCTIGNQHFTNFQCFACLGGLCACDAQGCKSAGAAGDFEIALTLSEDRNVLTGPADDRATGTYQDGAAYYFEHMK